MDKIVTLYENRYFSDMDVLTEFVNKVEVLRYRGVGMAVGLLAMLAVLVILSGPEQNYLYTGIAWVLVIIMLGVIYPKRNAKKTIKKSKDNFAAGLPENITWFEGDYIVTISGDDRSSFRYSEIKKLVETPNLYCLMINGTKGIILKKDSFTNCTFDAFKKYIETRVGKKTIVRQ